MKLSEKQFLGPDPEFTSYENAAAVILPFPYEGGVSYGKGTGQAPEAIINASHYLELYDEVLRAEPYRMGIATLQAPEIPADPQLMHDLLFQTASQLLSDEKFVIVIGGDHSISSAYFKALLNKYHTLSAIQIDAHSDLRDSYEGSKLSHASVMARIREMTPHALQMGIRSVSLEEVHWIERDNLSVFTMHEFRKQKMILPYELAKLPAPVFVTIDVDAFDTSVIMNTGTPEPGGFTWDEVMDVLNEIFTNKTVVGCDVVELSYVPTDRNSQFATAKLIYKLLGYKLLSVLQQTNRTWPQRPMGSFKNY